MWDTGTARLNGGRRQSGATARCQRPERMQDLAIDGQSSVVRGFAWGVMQDGPYVSVDDYGCVGALARCRDCAIPSLPGSVAKVGVSR